MLITSLFSIWIIPLINRAIFAGMLVTSKKNIANIITRILIKCTLAVLIVFAVNESTAAPGKPAYQDIVQVRMDLSGIPYHKGLTQGWHESTFSSLDFRPPLCNLHLQIKPLQRSILCKNNAIFYSPYTQYFFPLLNISGFSFKKQDYSFL